MLGGDIRKFFGGVPKAPTTATKTDSTILTKRKRSSNRDKNPSPKKPRIHKSPTIPAKNEKTKPVIQKLNSAETKRKEVKEAPIENSTSKTKEIVPATSDAMEIEQDPEKENEQTQQIPVTLNKPASGYNQWKNRGDPPKKGEKEIPVGADFCLFGKTFIITGVLESLDREQAAELITKYGGKVVKAINAKNLTHVVCGTDAGPKKMEVATARNLKILNEDELFSLIQTEKPKTLSMKDKQQLQKIMVPRCDRVKASKVEKSAALPSGMKENTSSKPDSSNSLWTTLYHPSRISDLVGNPTSIKKLKDWLSSWKPDMKKEKAVLLSGPPGVGKTSSATIVAKELGYEVIEFNASDTRSKKAMEQHIAELLGNKTISSMFAAKKPISTKQGKTALIMDEVDGMSGSDRGGVAKLIQLLKKTKMPVICICNDRQSTKIRSLRNYCLELTFREVTPLQVSSRLLGIAKNEQLQVDGETIFKIATMANGDIRQMLNMMQMHHVSKKHLNGTDAVSLSTKESSIGLFDVLPQLFNKEKYSKMSLAEKIQLYFTDPAMIPLFVQDNYISARPFNVNTAIPKRRQAVHLQLLSSAADSISDSDLFETSIRMEQQWSLMPLQGVLSSIRPAFYMQGNLGGKQNFPAWLGKNSSTNKNYRLLEDIRNHMQSKISASLREIRMQYLPSLIHPLSAPLFQSDSKQGVAQVIACMDEYGISRDDWNAIYDICQFSKMPNPIAGIPSATKSKFTREYNKSHKEFTASAQKSAKVSEPLLNINDDEEAQADNISDDEEENSVKQFEKKKTKKRAKK